MPTQQGVQIAFGTNTGGIVALYASVSATSESYKRMSDSAESKDGTGSVVSVTHTNFNDELSVELTVGKEAGVIPATPVPGTVVVVSLLAGGDPALAGEWLVSEASVKYSNADYAQTSLTLKRYAGINLA